MFEALTLDELMALSKSIYRQHTRSHKMSRLLASLGADDRDYDLFCRELTSIQGDIASETMRRWEATWEAS